MSTILVVDDDSKLLKMMRRTLTYEGFDVTTALNGHEALLQMDKQAPDVIILDWMMPRPNGLDVMHSLRSEGNGVPILMLTARDAIEDRVNGLDTGADDYLVKPFDPLELLARLRALLRRAEKSYESSALLYADLYLNVATRETRRSERTFELTPREFELLHLLMRNPHKVLYRERILEAVWGYDFGGEDNVLEVYIGYLRKKTEAGHEPRLIQTVRGVGYVLREG